MAELVELAYRRRRAHDTKSAVWKRLNYVIGGVTAVATALAGVAILADWWGKDVAGAVAVLAGVLTGLVAFYDFDERNVAARLGRAEWGRLHQDALSLDAQINAVDADALRERVDALYVRRYELEVLDAKSRLKD